MALQVHTIRTFILDVAKRRINVFEHVSDMMCYHLVSSTGKIKGNLPQLVSFMTADKVSLKGAVRKMRKSGLIPFFPITRT